MLAYDIGNITKEAPPAPVFPLPPGAGRSIGLGGRKGGECFEGEIVDLAAAGVAVAAADGAAAAGPAGGGAGDLGGAAYAVPAGPLCGGADHGGHFKSDRAPFAAAAVLVPAGADHGAAGGAVRPAGGGAGLSGLYRRAGDRGPGPELERSAGQLAEHDGPASGPV